MKIAYLGCESLVKDYLKARETLTYIEDAEWLISYNHHEIIPAAILRQFGKKAINLHISYLPYNRGAHPNVWSWIDDTPKGVTIHVMDEGIDTGPIIMQERLEIFEEETLLSSYLMLQSRLQNLFISHWDIISTASRHPEPQKGEGSYHNKKDMERYKYLINWNYRISTFCDMIADHQMSSQFWETYYEEVTSGR